MPLNRRLNQTKRRQMQGRRRRNWVLATQRENKENLKDTENNSNQILSHPRELDFYENNEDCPTCKQRLYPTNTKDRRKNPNPERFKTLLKQRKLTKDTKK